MRLKLFDEEIEPEKLFGPINFSSDSFEKFFIAKAVDLLFKETGNKINQDSQFRYISMSETSLNWMYDIELSKSSREQNMEIIYNDNRVYFKSVKRIFRGDFLNVFPSKDLEISLGLQFIPFQTDNQYICKKCSKTFEFQYNLMLHTRYFCTFNINNLLKNLKTTEITARSSGDEKKISSKRKQVEPESESYLKKNKNNDYHKEQQNKILETYSSYNTLVQNYTLNHSLRDYFLAQLAAYIGNQTKFNQEDKISNQTITESSSVLLSPSISPYQNTYNSNDSNNKAESVENFSINPNLIRKSDYTNLQSNSKIAQRISPLATKPNDQGQGNSIINKVSLQNWCAKCNTSFRLTSDLVYHMRTFHRKEEKKCGFSPVSILDFSMASTNTEKANREIKFLRCEICNETFKEKHHLTRHFTSHR
ncbi:unnamed protein product [Brachionus calyciflorus]|uniref:C2H2-type domain-containing protein n=1 Tax=Brachionus calyciflorus TaxID=104777 RepID=A0A813SAG5_9BILA|nr:unnamed protein product [Brachionus calyciflorus]